MSRTLLSHQMDWGWRTGCANFSEHWHGNRAGLGICHLGVRFLHDVLRFLKVHDIAISSQQSQITLIHGHQKIHQIMVWVGLLYAHRLSAAMQVVWMRSPDSRRRWHTCGLSQVQELHRPHPEEARYSTHSDHTPTNGQVFSQGKTSQRSSSLLNW